MGKLRVLVLSKLGMDLNAVKSLGETVSKLSGLTQLDISANSLKASHLVTFFHLIMGKNNLKSLNIAYNSGTYKRGP